ncbi:Disulfide bond formation protein DsbA [Methylocella tundrae]|uniref:Disulfide bond formation protein DsbA n=1 Tax=Methylocella tundrae TaxID=227605 RepID=A0A8B6M619_METTU|nr:DsbA family oxidoreductase [Methylocella tundrae]VTZ24966.1 Disulfide bond formation protein DsbA [Methylocella tundrae]VTZ49760.1 Disulfide bond formation protein DsbA [Methylocella tundrae]
MSIEDPSPIAIDLVADIASSECFIGLHLIRAVVGTVPGLSVDIRWRPFQIDPDMPPEGQDRAAYLAEKCGPPGEVHEVLANLSELAREFGLELAYDKIERQPNTLDAHRLIRFARNFGVEMAIVEALFEAFFLRGQDIGDRGVLAAIAGRKGIDPELVEAFLSGSDDIGAMKQELSGFRALGVEHVPRFIIAGKETITGVKSIEDFADALFRSIEDE